MEAQDVIDSSPLIKVDQAVRLAIQYAQTLPQLRGAEQPSLEEVEFSDGFWKVTLSFPRLFGASGALDSQRLAYKLFTIDPQTGSIVSMKIRNV